MSRSKPITVGQLIEALQKLPPTMRCVVWNAVEEQGFLRTVGIGNLRDCSIPAQYGHETFEQVVLLEN